MFTNSYKEGLKTICALITEGLEKIDFFEKDFDCVCLDKIAVEINKLNSLISKNLEAEIDFEELSAEDYSEIQLMLNYIAEFIEEGFFDETTHIIVSTKFALIDFVDELFSVSEEIKYDFSFTEYFIEQLESLNDSISGYTISDTDMEFSVNTAFSAEKFAHVVNGLSQLGAFVTEVVLLDNDKIKLSQKNYEYMSELIEFISNWVYDIHQPANEDDEFLSTPLLALLDSVLDLSLVFEVPAEYPIIDSEENDS